MSMEITTEEKIQLVSDWTETDGIRIEVIIRDGTVMEIGFSFHDSLRNKEAQFLYPHSNNLDSLRGLRNQLAEILIRLEQEMNIVHDASR